MFGDEEREGGERERERERERKRKAFHYEIHA